MEIFEAIKDFLPQTLKLEIAEEKSGHLSKQGKSS